MKSVQIVLEDVLHTPGKLLEDGHSGLVNVHFVRANAFARFSLSVQSLDYIESQLLLSRVIGSWGVQVIHPDARLLQFFCSDSCELSLGHYLLHWTRISSMLSGYSSLRS